MTNRRIALVLVSIMLAAACRSGVHSESPAAPTHSNGPDEALLRTLAVLATRRAPTAPELAATRMKIASGALSMAAYIDALVSSEEFASDVAPLLVLRNYLGQDAVTVPPGYILKNTGGADPTYYLGEPCSENQTQRVRPWWDLDVEVRVCRDSYLPGQWAAKRPKGEPAMDCFSFGASFAEDGGCGCGPNLFRCFKSEDHHREMADSLRAELGRSITHVVAADQPAELIFTSNETFRDRNAEFFRRAQLIALHRDERPEASLRDLATWPADGKWAPREDLLPGQNAGLLSANQLVFFSPDRRQRMSNAYDVMWCVKPDSAGATPEALLSIHGANLQISNDGWKELAARPICTNCHARLDYGMQFFQGYPNAYYETFFVPAQQRAGTGSIYVRDIDDRRGDGELNPLAFAKLAVSQPEFKNCMAGDVTTYVLGHRATPADVELVASQFHPQSTSLRVLMRTAMKVLVERWPSLGGQRAKPEPSQPGHALPEMVAVNTAMARQLDEHCLSCHDAEAGRIDLSKPALGRRDVVMMLELVSHGQMPKDSPLEAEQRRTFLDSFIAGIWSGADATAARAYYIENYEALPAYRPEVIFDVLHRSAGAKQENHWRLLEDKTPSEQQQLSPGLLTVAGLAALESCQERKLKGAELERCLAQALRIDNLASDPR